MIAEIINIGTELLLGDVTDTNSTYIASRLTELGFDINYLSTVGDNFQRIIKTIKKALKRSDIVITTGGLGPTTDDLTREAVASATGCSLEINKKLVQLIKDYFQSKNTSFTENNFRQAYLPRGAQPIMNRRGTAPGILLKLNNKTIICLPGVPREMKSMFKKQVFPYLTQNSGYIIKSKTLNFLGIGESALETKLKNIIDEQTNPTLALLASPGEVKLRITAKTRTKKEAYQLIEYTEKKVRQLTEKYIYATDDCSLEKLVGKLLKDKQLTVAIVESCTGGLIGDYLTSIPGSSSYFLGGIIAYSNQIKEKQLGVSPDTIADYGAVSKHTAREMACGIKKKFKSDIGLAVTGIAGPGGGTPQKPVGLVYLALAAKDYLNDYQLNLKGSRKNNKIMSCRYSLYYLHKYLKNLQVN